MEESIVYSSPFHFLIYFRSDIEKLDDSLIPQIKKQALLELQFSDNQFLEINNFHYSKQTILDFFNHIDSKNFEYHLYIWNHKDLLAFLEEQKIAETFIVKELAEGTDDEKYNLFIAPYLVATIIEIAKRDLKKHYFKNIINCMPIVKGFSIENKTLALKRVLRYYKNIILRINLNAKSNEGLKVQYHFLLNDDFYILINSLPDEFYYLQDDIADCLINLVYYNYKDNRETCRDISKKTLLLNCSFERKATLEQNHEATKPQYKGYLKLFVFVIFFIVRMSLCEANHNKENNPKFKYQEYNTLFFNENLNKTKNEIGIHNIQEEIIKGSIKQNKKRPLSNAPLPFYTYSEIDSSNFFNKERKIKIINNTTYDAIFIGKNEMRYVYKKVNSKSTGYCDVEQLDLSYFFYLGNQWDTINKIVYSSYKKEYKKTIRTSMNGSFVKTDKNTMSNLKVKYSLKDSAVLKIDYSEKDSMIYISNQLPFIYN